MTLHVGQRIGAYEISAAIGSGGMGEVYRARDTKLGRDVALKVLPDLFANDPERLARFQREAQVLASLNHPNIAAIYGLEEADPSTGPVLSDVRPSTGSGRTESNGSGQAVKALVLELVEGPTLAECVEGGSLSPGAPAAAAEHAGARQQRVGVGPHEPIREAGRVGVMGKGLAVTEALPTALQIAEALEAAHEHGIIHRDLKPANIKVRPDGTVKVLDFGLAKLAWPGDMGGPSGDFSQSPTLTTPAATRMGVVMGTAAYMAPEQAKGKPIDRRVDIWAFGCVLYEMLTGKRAFDGEDVTDVLVAVMGKEPDWTALPPQTPPAIRRLVQRCLDTNRKERVPDIAVARMEIRDALTAPPAETGTATVEVRSAPWRRPASLAAACALTAVIVGVGVWAVVRPAPLAVDRFAVTLPLTDVLVAAAANRPGPVLAISPDGRTLIYAANRNGVDLLYRRPLDQLAAVAIAGTEGAGHPFFSPDGQWLGFLADGKLKKISLAGGPPLTLCDAPGNNRGVSWGPNDRIVFAGGDPLVLKSVSAAGGIPEALTTLDADEALHGYPHFLPTGDALLFMAQAAGGVRRVVAYGLETGERRALVEGSNPRYVSTGHLLFAREQSLWAIAFDVNRLSVSGDPFPVLESVRVNPGGSAEVGVAGNGSLVYLPGGGATTPQRTLWWVDRQGREEPVKGPPRVYASPRLSPDGTKVALDVRGQENDIWIWDFARTTLTRLTFDPTSDQSPVWTPDGKRIVFGSARERPVNNLFWQAADGTGAVERLTESPNSQVPFSFSADGKRLVLGENGGNDLGLLSFDGERRTQPLIRTQFTERNAEISPDGRWIAYESNESGQYEVYVRPFPNVDEGRWQISTGGGAKPLWARSGRELLYLAPGTRLMVVPVTSGPTFATGNPELLFEGRYVDAQFPGRTYDVSPDGKRFLMIKEGIQTDEGPTLTQIVVVLNWFEELKRLAVN